MNIALLQDDQCYLRHLSVFDRCAKTSGCLMPSKFTRTKHRKLSHRCLPSFVTQIKYNCNYNWNISALSHSQSASAVFLSTTQAFCTFSWAEPSTTRIRCCTRCRPHWEHPELQHMTELITLDLIWSAGATDWTNKQVCSAHICW